MEEFNYTTKIIEDAHELLTKKACMLANLDAISAHSMEEEEAIMKLIEHLFNPFDDLNSACNELKASATLDKNKGGYCACIYKHHTLSFIQFLRIKVKTSEVINSGFVLDT